MINLVGQTLETSTGDVPVLRRSYPYGVCVSSTFNTQVD